jgi:hypothetical protein
MEDDKSRSNKILEEKKMKYQIIIPYPINKYKYIC